jgi:hypothetical protein
MSRPSKADGSAYVLIKFLGLYARLYFFLQLKQEYIVLKNMRNRSGWGWNDSNNTPNVSDNVWEAYIQVRLSVIFNMTITNVSSQTLSNKPMARALRTKGFPLFDDIAELVDHLQKGS